MTTRIARLTVDDAAIAARVFALMADVFEEKHENLGVDYVRGLLVQPSFWALGAFAGDAIVGGVTAHTLPMTRTASSEIFLYDIAVRADYQRKGVGRDLVDALRAEAAKAGVHEMFVAADEEDEHALDFYRALGGEEARVRMFSFHRSAM